MSVSQTGCILHRKANTFPPTALLELILKENSSGWGAAIVSEVDNTKFIETNSGIEGLSMDDLQDTLKTFVKQDVTFYFCSSEVALAEQDMSPYVLVSKPSVEDPEQEEPQLVAFIRGNFPAHVQAGSSHPPEYHLVKDILTPKFKGLYEMVDGDLDKLMENLKKPHFKKELLLNSVSEGTITLLAANGVCITFDQGNQSAEGPWGWVSNAYGYKAEEKAAPPVAPEKKKGMFSRSTVREKAGTSEPVKEPIAESLPPPKTDTTVLNNYTVKKWKPQASYSRKERKNAYKMRIGYAPKGWQDSIEVDVFYGPDNKIMTFAQVKALGIQATGLLSLAKNPERDTSEDRKDTEPHEVKSEQTLPATTEKKVVAEILPIMGPKTREHINDIRRKDGYKKIIADNAEVITDPKQAENFETKFADFARQMGIKTMHEFAYWDFEMIYDLCKTDTQGAAVMLNTFKNLWLKANPAVVEQETKEETPPKKQGMFKRSSAA